MTIVRPTIKDGLYLNLSETDYHDSSAISRSQLMELKKSPAHFIYKVNNPDYNETADFRIGKAIHCLLLENEYFLDRFIKEPEVNKRTKAAKQELEDFYKKHKEKCIMTPNEYNKAYDLYEAVKHNEQIKIMLAGNRQESSIFWTDAETGIQFKARPDSWADTYMVDIKTTKNAEHYAFSRTCLDYGYYCQAGMCFEAAKAAKRPIQTFVFVCIEKEPPYAQAIYMIENDTLDFCVEIFNKYKHILKKCYDHNNWQSYPTQFLNIPEWQKKQLEGEF